MGISAVPYGTCRYDASRIPALQTEVPGYYHRVPMVVRKNRSDVTNPDKVFGVRQLALPHSKCSVEIVTVLPVLRQIKDDFFSEPMGRCRNISLSPSWVDRSLKCYIPSTQSDAREY